MFARCIQIKPNTKAEINAVTEQGSLAPFWQLVIGPQQAYLLCILASLLGFYARPHWSLFHTARNDVSPSVLLTVCQTKQVIHTTDRSVRPAKLRYSSVA